LTIDDSYGAFFRPWVDGMSVCHSYKAKHFLCRLEIAGCQGIPLLDGFCVPLYSKETLKNSFYFSSVPSCFTTSGMAMISQQNNGY
jgi:hypothetical protein